MAFTNFTAVAAETFVGNLVGNVTGNLVALPVTARTATAAPGGVVDGRGGCLINVGNLRQNLYK